MGFNCQVGRCSILKFLQGTMGPPLLFLSVFAAIIVGNALLFRQVRASSIYLHKEG